MAGEKKKKDIDKEGRGGGRGYNTIGVEDLESAKTKCLDDDSWSYGVVAPLLSVSEGELPVPAMDGGHWGDVKSSGLTRLERLDLMLSESSRGWESSEPVC